MDETKIQKLGKYDVLRVIGKGAMGIVYEGVDPVIKRQVAIKTIHKALLHGEGGQELRERFKREAQAAGRLLHQNICAIYDYGEELDIPFIVMEFIEGRELKSYIAEQVRFEIPKILDIMQQTLSALAYVHQGGVVHRDVKPANIIILENGQIKVADFGIARIESSTMTQMGTVMGTPHYMSPEQFMGQQVDNRSDLFSVGIILYELMTGEKPFPGVAMATIMQKVLYTSVDRPTVYNVNIPKAFDVVITKALSKRPDDRFQCAEDFMEAIKLAANNKTDVPVGQGVQEGSNADGTIVTTPLAPINQPVDNDGANQVTGSDRQADNQESMEADQVQSQAEIAAKPGVVMPISSSQKAAADGVVVKKSHRLSMVAGIIGLLLIGSVGFWFQQNKLTTELILEKQEQQTQEPIPTQQEQQTLELTPAKHEPLTQGPTQLPEEQVQQPKPPELFDQTSQPIPSIEISMQTNHSPDLKLQVGDKLMLLINLSRSGYLYCYYQDSDGVVAQVYPNRFQLDRYIKSNQILMVPDATNTNSFTIALENANADEKFMCVATEIDIETLPVPLQEGDLVPLAVESLDAVLSSMREVITKAGGIMGMNRIKIHVW